ncbi:hypothetical protein E8E13_001608 [Curvularia kusanoi]|uniref:F-box domain-containing protein n=1 Tax=Curvularia kusanoi TaxID=90978 RepID=A0A9P4W6T5_CURKU|nr:hypothetical protein E8E13_001608 [Curvularia kusanoi]
MSLETLPLEILFHVLDYISNPFDPTSSKSHPLNNIAATSKHFDRAVEEYTRALLQQYASFAYKKKSKYTCRKKWLAEYSNASQTMTTAIRDHNLSKLDIFTPNRLYPTLPPLTHGEYPIMGGVATMFYEPDLASRRDYIHSQLSDEDRLDKPLKTRVRRHEVLIRHMSVAYSTSQKRWYRTQFYDEVVSRPGRRSLETKESREEFVRKQIAFERDQMGMEGSSEENAIELD